MKKNENIEDLFKKSFENFEAEVKPGIWPNIQTALKGAGIGLLAKTLLNKIGANTLAVIVSSAAAVISTVVVMNWESAHNKKTAVYKKPVVIEKAKPVKVEEIKNFLSNTPLETVPKSAPIGEIKQPDNEQKTKDITSGTIKKEKINALITEYKDSPVAAISANPIGGTVPLVVNLSNSGTGKINKWNFGDGQRENGVNPVHVYDVPGHYTIALTSTNADGTTAVDSVKIDVSGNSSISAVTKEFTPNGDGVNDVFTLQSKNIAVMNAKIFDKKGTIIYKSDGVDAKWSGLDLHGKEAPNGVYFYLITAEGVDGKKYEQKGKINLTR